MSAFLLRMLALGLGSDDPISVPKPSEPEPVIVVFRVAVPSSTPKDAKVYVAGNLPELGEWGPDVYCLKRLDDGRYALTRLLPRGAVLEYKFTLGSWDRCEQAADGGTLGNRVLALDRDGPIEVDAEVAAWSKAPPAPKKPEGKPAAIKAHRAFSSALLGNDRDVLVWLPPGYDDEPERRYPVAYFQDGQNLFDAAGSFGGEWRADETAEQLVRAGKIPPVILVGVANTKDRVDEYTPVAYKKQNMGGKGPLYARFVVEELKPFIDRTYRTRPGRASTAVIGSSLGGLAAIEMTLDHPEAFGLCAAMSPSIWWSGERVVADVKARAEAAKLSRYWIDMGTREGRTGDAEVERARRLEAALRDDGLEPERDFHFEIVEGGEHNEAAWAARLDRVLIYLFGR